MPFFNAIQASWTAGRKSFRLYRDGESMSLLHITLFLVCLCPSVAGAVQVHAQRNPQTGLSSWKAEEGGFSLELVQLPPDYVKAFYEARGVPPELMKGMEQYCVFGSIARNESHQPLSYRVADWRYVTPDGAEHPLKTKSDWVNEWRELGVAYMWSLLPDDQTLDGGDWNQGFTTVALPPDSAFDLLYSWSRNGQTYTARIPGMRCAPAQAPAP